jgi:3-phosphoshikimate 1-carboxyvinyltransferase
MGAMATSPITAVFTGDVSLRSRPMARVVAPLEAFGLHYEGQGPKALMPLTLHGAKDAKGATVHVATASAQVKSALLLAALNAEGVSVITQPVRTRDHTEKMLRGFGAEISVRPQIVDQQGNNFADQEFGDVITLKCRARLTGRPVEVPRDPSSAAFAIVAALIVPGSEIFLPAILLNERRIGLIQTLEEMGARIEVTNARDSGGERIGDLLVRHSELRGVTVPPGRAASMIDEYPILSVAAAFATGETKMRGLEELRVKESDRLAGIVAGLEANGVPTSVYNDDLTVSGMGQEGVPGGGTVSTHMDHRIAMAFLTMGMASQNPVTVDDVTMIATSFPEYQDLMRGLGAEFAG